MEEPILSPDQLAVMEIFKAGKNICINSAGGCGKSFLISIIKSYSEGMGKNIAVTATTGTAAVLLGNGAKTIYAYAGIGIGNGTIENILKNIKKNGAYSRWKALDILIIDEISMMGCEIFELLNGIGKQIRRNKKPFGGIQLVLCGDFCQLPPIGKELKYIFESSDWSTVIHQTVVLTTNHRQSDPQFIQLLDEVRFGHISEETREILNSRIGLDYKSLEIQPTHLYSTNIAVEKINDAELLKLNNEIKIFHIKNATVDKNGEENGIDYSSKKIINSIEHMDKTHQYALELKLAIDAQVMLIVNLDVPNGLANGSRGVVKSFAENGNPLVLFLNGMVVEIAPYTWYNDDQANNFGRIQIPLKLAYAITIHKIQGATLDCVLINLSNIFQDGQAYVALSRVRSLSGLYIIAIDYSKIRACRKVLAFYGMG
uniref:AAA+ ATPase domain-containing protein n=1 Tax=viral metagenome TaxID=1070528 RepID=A0A6C0I0R6_9ZZZZ